MSTFSGSPLSAPSPRPRSALPWLIGFGVLVVLLVVGALVWAFSGSTPETVEDVADRTVDAAEDLDVGTGIELLCEAPTEEERREFNEFLGEAKEEAGTDRPEVNYVVSKVTGEEEGSFHLEVTSDEGDLGDRRLYFKVLVESHDGRACISGIAEADED